MKRTFKWFLLNGLFVAAMYFAYFENIEGAERVAVFWAWALGLLSFGYITEATKKAIKEKGRAVPAFIDLIFDLAICTTFVWFGAMWTGAIYFFHLLMHHAAFSLALKEESEES